MSECPGKHHHHQMPAAAPAAAGGKAYWRSLDDWANTPEFRQWAQREFPALASELDESYADGGTSRRRFLQLMGASIALAGLGTLGGCRRTESKIRAYNKKPEPTILGKPTYYATTMVLAGRPLGVLAETHEGRPTKIEGNPSHPASYGATHVFAQASVLDLYDPDRSRVYRREGQAVTKEEFYAALDELASALRSSEGRGLAILGQDHASPAAAMLREHIALNLPQATFHVYEPSRQIAPPRYHLDKAQVILTLDCDLLGLEDDGIRYKRDFAAGRKVEKPGDAMNRLYAVEPHFTITGASADHRLRLPASAVGPYVWALAAKLGVVGTPGPKAAGISWDRKWIDEVAADLKAHAGRSLLAVGARQPLWVHALVARINAELDNVGQCVSPAASGPSSAGIASLAEQLKSGSVSTLLILGGNPAYDAPADLDFANLIKKARTSLYLSAHETETSAVCTWHVPAAHYLESWGDAETADGVISPIQPMIEPLFDRRNPLELLARISGYETSDPYEIVRRSFKRLTNGTEADWRRFLHEGTYALSRRAAEPRPLAMDVPAAVSLPSPDRFEVCFAMDDSVFDGRFGNNGWMQECPDPMTKLTWDNAAILSPRSAERLKVKTGDVLRIELDGRSLEMPAFVMPGHADWSLTLPLGYGRKVGGSLVSGTGFNAYTLRTTAAMGFAVGAKVTKTGRTYPLGTTQEHWAASEDHLSPDKAAQERAIIREGTLDRFQREPDFARHMGEKAPTKLNIYTSPTLDGANQWGMAVDLSACVGCTACVVACQAENNIPIVGKNEVIRGREMHWMRLDRYFAGEDPAGDVEATLQPMMCQHCENAPCEPVCPVNATVHSPEGLNEMVYNRCVGTRYCSNNCPYKVRRFNFLDYNKGTIRESGREPFDGNPEPNPLKGLTKPQLLQPPMQELIKMQKNPQVTVRMRGVMEKCTYCVQRLEAAKIDAQSAVGQSAAPAGPDGKPAVKVPDGAVQTACQQACPTQAIVFGDVSDPSSRVSRLRSAQRSYAVLEHVNTKPRTLYLARLRNVNPKMESQTVPLPVMQEALK